MTMFVRFTRTFDHTDVRTGKRTRYPAGWSGEVTGDIEKRAREAGVLAAGASVPSRAADEGLQPVDHEKMTLAGLKEEAERRGVKVKASANKAELAEAINRALEQGAGSAAGGAVADVASGSAAEARDALQPVDPEALSVADLRAEAERRGVKVKASASKAELAEAINRALEQGAGSAAGGSGADGASAPAAGARDTLQPVDPEALSVADLRAEAERRGVEVGEQDTRAEMAEKINAALQPAGSSTEG